MDIERSCLIALFKHLPYQLILDDLAVRRRISDETVTSNFEHAFLQAARVTEPLRTGDELNCYLQFVNKCSANPKGIFSLLFNVSNVILDATKEGPCCRQEHLLRWRELSHILGQDLFTAALYAQIDNNATSQVPVPDFVWRPALRVDDEELYRILHKGMAENHYHLNGSTQVFPLTWACLMNHIASRGPDFKVFGQYLTPQVSFDLEPGTHYSLSLYQKCIVAASIRAFLFSMERYHKSAVSKHPRSR